EAKKRSRKARKGLDSVARKSAEARGAAMQKTSVYLDQQAARRLLGLARRLGRPQSQIIREAIDSYEPSAGGDRNFALAAGFERIDKDRRPISEISKRELRRGFGE